MNGMKVIFVGFVLKKKIGTASSKNEQNGDSQWLVGYLYAHRDSRRKVCMFTVQMLEHTVMICYVSDVVLSIRHQPVRFDIIQVDQNCMYEQIFYCNRQATNAQHTNLRV